VRIAVVVAAALLQAALELLVFRRIGTSLSSNGSADALAAIQTFRLLIAFGVALAVANALAVALLMVDRRRIASALVVAFLSLVVGWCAAALSVVTFLVPLLAYGVLFLYALPIVAAGSAPLRGVVESAALGLRDARYTAPLVIGLIVAWMVGAFVASRLGAWSDIGGWLLLGVVQQASVAYVTLKVARRYASAGVESGL